MTNPTKIVGLRVENVKRIKAVSINPKDSSLIQITGKNGQGKSSILDSIVYALGGKKHLPDQPIRAGEASASVIIETDTYIIERVWKGDKTEVKVKNKENAAYTSPQDLLNGLYGDLTFDPLEFSRMKPADQVATLKKVANLDFDEIDSLRRGTFDERTVVNRDLKQAAAQLAAVPAVDAPDEEISFTDLTDQINNALAVNKRNEIHRSELKAAEVGLQQKDELVQRLEKQLAGAQKAQAEQVEVVQRHKQHVESLKDMDVESLQKQLATAEETNRLVRQKQQRAKLAAQVETFEKKTKELTAKIEELDQQKQEKLLAASFPVAALSLCEHGLIYNGVPFNQACSAEQLRVSVAMGLALNPKLKVMLVREGSLLDSDGRQLLAQMAEEAGAQVWMERATDGEPIGIVIEDGEVKEVEGAEKASEPVAAN